MLKSVGNSTVRAHTFFEGAKKTQYEIEAHYPEDNGQEHQQ